MFLAETREHLEQLNLAIVKLEGDPTDQATVGEIFRIAHSLKGMSATMGFANIAELTHHMEDVFELLRQRTSGLPSEAIDTVFACLDALSAAAESIEADGQEALDPAPLVSRLRGLVRPRTAEQEMARNGGVDEPSRAAVEAARAAGARVLLVRVALTKDVMMPAVRAHMVLAALSDHGEVLGSVPAPEGLEQFQGREISAWVASDHEDEPIIKNLSGVSEVASVTVADITEPEEAVAPPEVVPEPAIAVVPEPGESPRVAPAPAAEAGPGPRKAGRPANQGHTDRPGRRRASRRADALDGRARDPPHRGRGTDRAPRGRGPPARRTGADPQLAGPPGDGHAGPDDPRRRGLPALPAADPRPVDQARQGGQARTGRLGHRARPHRRRRPRRPARPPRPQLPGPWPRAARRPRGGRQAAPRHDRDHRPPRRRERRDRGPGRRQGNRPRHRRPQGFLARHDRRGCSRGDRYARRG